MKFSTEQQVPKTLKIVKKEELTADHWYAFYEIYEGEGDGNVGGHIHFIKLFCFDEDGKRNSVSLKKANDFRKMMEGEYLRIRREKLVKDKLEENNLYR